MQTQAQKRFDADYVILRRLFVRSGMKSKDKKGVLNWIRIKGEEVAHAAGREVRHDPQLIKQFIRPSVAECVEMSMLSDITGDDDE